MIEQSLLRDIKDGEILIRDLEQHDETVKGYLALQRSQKALNDGLRERVKLQEAVEPGPLSVQDKVTISIQWERFWQMIREQPKVAKVIESCAAVKTLLKRLAERDATAPWATVVHKVTVLEVPTPASAEASA